MPSLNPSTGRVPTSKVPIDKLPDSATNHME